MELFGHATSSITTAIGMGNYVTGIITQLMMIFAGVGLLLLGIAAVWYVSAATSPDSRPLKK